MLKEFFAKYCSLYKVWNNENINKWKRQRQGGVVKFVLFEGVLKWGIPSTMVFLSITLLGKNVEQEEIIITCLIWLSASILYGFLFWCGTSLAYKKQFEEHVPNQ